MIIGNVRIGGATSLPVYLGATRVDDKLMSGSDSIFIMDASLQMILYCQALNSESLSLVPMSAQIGRGKSLHYSELLRRLAGFAEAPESDDLGRVRPSGAAIDTASRIAFRIFKAGIEVTVLADVSVDRDGDIRILWERGDRSLELVCPFELSRRPYIYYSEGCQYSLAYDLSAYRLGRLFAWLAGRTDQFPR